jgi:hypothetical protein
MISFAVPSCGNDENYLWLLYIFRLAHRRFVAIVAVAILFGRKSFDKCFKFKKFVYFKIYVLYNDDNKLEEISV